MFVRLGEAISFAMSYMIENDSILRTQISDDSGEIYTNERMLKAAVSFANVLRGKGFVKGDKIVLLMHNHHYMLPTWVGCVLAGVILCPFHFTNSSVKGQY